MKEESERRRRILDIILLGSIVMLLVFDAIILIYSTKDGARYKEMSFQVFSILPVFFLFLYALSRRGKFVIASYLLVGSYFVSNSYAAFRWGVTMQSVILAYALIIVMATILRGSKFGFVTTGAIGAFILPVWYLQFNGTLSTQKQELRSVDAGVFVIMYFLLMIIAWLYDREIEKSLLIARASQQELERERDNLEIIVTERTEELRRTQLEKIDQLNHFAEIGQLSSGLFHDIFNLLSAVSLRSENPTGNPMAEATKTTHRIESLTQAIRNQLNARKESRLFSLSENIEHVIQLLEYKINKTHVRIRREYNNQYNDLYWGTPSKFHQVVLNLLLNAVESFDSLPANDLRNRIIMVHLATKDQITLQIKDNGCGIPPDILPKIFNEFFSTKNPDKGIGIGLYTTKKIVIEDLAGTIDVASTLGEGTIFTIKFPIHNERSLDTNHESP